MATRIFRIHEVVEITGLSRSSIYALAKSGEFVKPIQLTVHCIGWRQIDIEGWLEDRRAQGYAPKPRLSPDAIARSIETRRIKAAARKVQAGAAA